VVKHIGVGFINDIKHIVEQSRREAYTAVNQAMVSAYWQIGRRIVEEEQHGQQRAGYGKQLLKQLSKVLTAEYGKWFSVQTLYYYRQFYITFPNIFPTAWGISSEKFSMPWGILTLSHYKRLLSVSNEAARNWYLREASEQMWSYALDAEVVKVADYELEPAYA
jgi:hypothetical protein